MTDTPNSSASNGHDNNISAHHNDNGDEANNRPPPADDDAYDVIICGTDLIQSILSSALSRAGKKVLHCDGNEWYGGFDAVLYGGSTLDSFIEGCEQSAGSVNKGEDGEEEDAKEKESSLIELLQREKYGDLRLHSQTFICHEKDSSNNDEAKSNMDGNVPVDAVLQKLSIDDAEKEGKHESNDGAPADASIANNERAVSTTEQQPKPNVAKSLEHGFCFDLTPSLLYASGDAVESLVKSGVSDYLEFKSLKGLYLLMAEEEKASSSARSGRRGRASKSKKTADDNGDGNEEKKVADGGMDDKKFASYRVPCSKGDVFRSKLLSPVDKRRLMKFLQLISDYGMAMQMEEAQSSYNAAEESEVAEGDDAANEADETKPESEGVSGEDAIQSINERFLHQGRALSRPQNKATPSSSEMDALMRCVREGVSFSDFLTKVAKLPERLSTVVVYALALAPFGYLDQNEKGEVNGAKSHISQYSTKEGVDDLVRHITALGRFGDTAFLVPMYGSGELSQAFCRSGAVYGSTYMLRRSPLSINLDENSRVKGVILSGEERIGGNGDVDTDDVSDTTLSCKHVIVPSTMMDLSNGSKSLQTRTYRRICVLQGQLMLDQDQNDKTDTEQRYAIIIPPETHGLKIKAAIHCVAVDDSACVAPRGNKYTVLHLTTSSQDDDDASDELHAEALGKAVELLIASQPTKDDAVPIQECYHMTFSYVTATPSSSESKGTNKDQPGLHICYRDKQTLTCDSAFSEARRIFETICPKDDFLELAKKVEDAIVYRDEHDSDDEKMVLESACTMIQTPVIDDKPEREDDGAENSNNDV